MSSWTRVRSGASGGYESSFLCIQVARSGGAGSRDVAEYKKEDKNLPYYPNVLGLPGPPPFLGVSLTGTAFWLNIFHMEKRSFSN